MSWRSRKQFIFGGVVLIILVVVIGVPTVLKLRTDPTCFDGKQNGDEKGIDCGGSCEKVCSFEAKEPSVLWARSFEVANGVYNAVAFIENPNRNISAQNVSYTFKLFDSENLLVFERKGLVDIPSATSFVIFEDSIFTGERNPQTTFFEFTKEIEWLSKEVSAPGLKVTQRILEEEETPKIRATIENASVNNYNNIEAVVVVFDVLDNAIASSRTFIEELEKRSNKEIIFTWPNAFDESPSKIEIFLKVGSE